MPYVDGKFSRSAGQGYARAKAMQGEKHEDSPPVEGDKGSTGSVVHVKHHGGGKLSIKHEDGEVTHHEGMDDAAEHMKQHFGMQEPESGGEEDDSEYDSGDGGEALKSILG
jgi:hypothetical protein